MFECALSHEWKTWPYPGSPSPRLQHTHSQQRKQNNKKIEQRARVRNVPVFEEFKPWNGPVGFELHHGKLKPSVAEHYGTRECTSQISAPTNVSLKGRKEISLWKKTPLRANNGRSLKCICSGCRANTMPRILCCVLHYTIAYEWNAEPPRAMLVLAIQLVCNSI